MQEIECDVYSWVLNNVAIKVANHKGFGENKRRFIGAFTKNTIRILKDRLDEDKLNTINDEL